MARTRRPISATRLPLPALKARLPAGALAVCSPARRTRETALRLGLDPVEQSAFREQDFGAWTGRRHNDLITELGAAYHEFWKSPARNRPPGGESFVDQIDRARAGLALLPAGRCGAGGAFRHHPRRACDRTRSGARFRAAFRHRSAVTDQDRSPRGRLARWSRSTSVRKTSDANPARRAQPQRTNAFRQMSAANWQGA